jgi:VanZ family protein
MSALRFVPPLVWTALIAWLSSSGWSAAHTGPRLSPLFRWLLPWAAPEQVEAVHWVVRKSAHLVEYGVLALLWSRALRRGEARRAWRTPLALVVLTASLDEWHQSLIGTRGGSALDVLLDATGAGAVLIALHGGVRELVRWLTGALLWVAAAGGAVAIALDWSAGAPLGWLGWSVPAAWLALAVWLRTERG